MYEMPKCKCGEELEFDNDMDLWIDENTVTIISCGHCPKCGKNINGLTSIKICLFYRNKKLKLNKINRQIKQKSACFFVEKYYLTNLRRCVKMSRRRRSSCAEFTIIPPAADFVNRKFAQIFY